MPGEVNEEGFDPSEPPAMAAVRLAMKAAEEAAEARARAKAEARGGGRGELVRGDDDWDVIAETAVDREAFESGLDEPGPGVNITFDLGGGVDGDAELASLVAELERTLPDLPGEETHGDLVIHRPESQAPSWYELAAEESLPAALRDLAGPMDVKRLLTALIVEVGDVKRTNAMLMETLARIEEKVDRTARHFRNQPGR